MKFEIDDKTGKMMGIVIPNGDIGEYDIQSTDLEQILQAVKKTQEKLLNKQIQEIQDSKHMTISQPKFEINGDNVDLEGDNVSISAIDLKKDAHLTVKCTENHTKIEQNQKIVDKLLEKYNTPFKYLGGADAGTYKDLTQREAHFKICVEQIIKETTGKDIKDLDNNFKSKSGDTMTGNTTDL